MFADPNERELLARFPKQRPPLPQEYQSIYVEHYRSNRSGQSPASSIAQRMEAWMHRQAAKDASRRSGKYDTLEVGAGNLNHVQYEPTSGRYDIVEPFRELYADSPSRSRITQEYRSVDEIHDRSYDRIVSIATFEHICELPSVVAQCGLLLSSRGALRAAIPSEGKLLWRLGWTLTTGLEFRRRYLLDYGLLMQHEHVNTADEINAVLHVFFKSVRRSFFGLTPAISLYQFMECTNPDIRKCEDYLERERTR